MKEVEIKGVKYKIGRLSAMKQMLILKRATAILGAFQSAFGNQGGEQPEKALESMGQAISQLPDESLEYIVKTCLDACERKEAGGGWAQVAVKGDIMFADLDLLTLLSLVSHALLENFRSFFQELPSIALAGEMLAKA